ncbi:MAG: hypothetical protein ACE5JP_14120 [Candidatus Bipolaricaulia bacterium]
MKHQCNVSEMIANTELSDERETHPDEREPRMERKTYLDERKLLIDAEREALRSFDKAILTLSAGALGLSITFIRQLAPEPQVETLRLLAIAWIAFGLSLLSTLFSFLTSQSALRRQREILDQDYENEKPNQNYKNWQAKITNILNLASILSFIVGLIFLAWFSIENLT